MYILTQSSVSRRTCTPLVTTASSIPLSCLCLWLFPSSSRLDSRLCRCLSWMVLGVVTSPRSSLLASLALVRAPYWMHWANTFGDTTGIRRGQISRTKMSWLHLWQSSMSLQPKSWLRPTRAAMIGSLGLISCVVLTVTLRERMLWAVPSSCQWSVPPTMTSSPSRQSCRLPFIAALTLFTSPAHSIKYTSQWKPSSEMSLSLQMPGPPFKHCPRPQSRTCKSTCCCSCPYCSRRLATILLIHSS